jgi:hypothetical protein
MTRPLVLALALVALGALTAAGGQPAPATSMRPAVLANAGDAGTLDALMTDLRIAPLEPVAPPALTVTTLEGGGRVSLADLKGRAVLVYFWATW